MKYLKLTLVPIAAALVLGGVAFAQQANPSSPSGTMDQGQMMQGGTSAMPMMGMMREMSTMMENCNKMMQSMMDQQKDAPTQQQQPAPQGKGG